MVVVTPGFLVIRLIGLTGVVLIETEAGLIVVPEGFLVTGF